MSEPIGVRERSIEGDWRRTVILPACRPCRRNARVGVSEDFCLFHRLRSLIPGRHLASCIEGVYRPDVQLGSQRRLGSFHWVEGAVCLSGGRGPPERDYHRMSPVAAISSKKRIGSSPGATSHSRTLDLEIFDIL